MHKTLGTGTATLILGAALIAAGPVRADTVIPDDLIVQGSACVGLDCVDGESFGFDTLRLKENNTRIKFDDTSTSVGFPNNDWQLTANDSVSGGLNKFSIENITVATVPFTVVGAAPTNSMFIDNSGKLGLHTTTPGLAVHVNTSDTPGQRFEQNNSGGFSAQTWDVAGNEANFFVRDLTGGSKLPFRIRPGAPTSSIDIAASGNVGIGTASARSNLDINGSAANIGVLVKNTAAGGHDWQLLSSATGGLSAGGFHFFDNTAGASRLALDGGGNVGVGTTGPIAKLDVAGTVRVASLSSAASQVCIDASNILATCSSDMRLKRDINYLGGDTGLNAIMQLKPARYRWHDGDERIMAGFVAQDTQPAVPEAVFAPKGSEFLSFDQGAVLSYAVKAIQELKADNDNLRREIDRLKAKL